MTVAGSRWLKRSTNRMVNKFTTRVEFALHHQVNTLNPAQ